MKKIAIIPARSGSKGLKDKNIKNLCGKPLLAYTIEAALNSNIFDEVIVSTDSNEYGKIAESFGATYFERSKELAEDSSPTYVVIEDILNKINSIEYFVLLQPTSPLRNEKHIKEACDKFELNYDKYDFLVSVKEAEHNEDLVKQIDEDNSLKNFNKDFSNYKRQGSKYYEPNGAIFIGKPKQYLEHKHFFGDKAIAYYMNKKDSIDIDDEIDFKIAETLIKMEKK